MKYFNALLIIAFSSLFACIEKKIPGEKSETEASPLTYLKNAQKLDRAKYNDITIYGSLGNKFAGGSINAVYRKQDDDGTPVTFSDFLVNNSTIPVDSRSGDERNNVHAYFYSPVNKAFEAIFGKTITVTLIKTRAAARAVSVEYKMYNPKLVKITNAEQIENFVPSEDLPFIWETDPDNNDQPMVLNLILRTIGKEQKWAETSVSLTKVVKDNGSYTIPAKELAIFPEESRVSVSLYRGNQELIDDNLFSLYNCNLITAITGKAKK